MVSFKALTHKRNARKYLVEQIKEEMKLNNGE